VGKKNKTIDHLIPKPKQFAILNIKLDDFYLDCNNLVHNQSPAMSNFWSDMPDLR
jgi:hypothetical protein